MFLLDTNVISELRSGKPRQSASVRAWAETVPANQFYLSSISVLELEMGVRRMERKDGPQGQVLRAWVATVMQQFQDQVLPFTAQTALLCAPMHVPDARSFRDSMIASGGARRATSARFGGHLERLAGGFVDRRLAACRAERRGT